MSSIARYFNDETQWYGAPSLILSAEQSTDLQPLADALDRLTAKPISLKAIGFRFYDLDDVVLEAAAAYSADTTGPVIRLKLPSEAVDKLAAAAAGLLGHPGQRQSGHHYVDLPDGLTIQLCLGEYDSTTLLK